MRNKNQEVVSLAPTGSAAEAEKATNDRVEKPAVEQGKIVVHPNIKKQLACVPVMDLSEEEDFLEVFDALLYEYDARTFSEQREVFDIAQRTVEGRRYQLQSTLLVGREMKPAAVAVFRGRIEPAGRPSPVIDQQARDMAEKNREGDTYNQDDLELEGFGNFPIETEATKRAMPALNSLERLRASNGRAKANSHRLIERLKLMKKKPNG
jgi:hypothetical protein